MRQKILLKTIMTLIQQYGEDCKLEALLEIKRTTTAQRPTLVREEKPKRQYTRRKPDDSERVPT